MKAEIQIRAYGGLTHPGSVRPLNEDRFFANPEMKFFGVIDAYGGQNIGDVAAKTILEKTQEFVKHGLGDSEVTLPFVYRRCYSNDANIIFNAMHFANEWLVGENEKLSINTRAGANVLCGMLFKRRLILANVGLCQAFLVRKGVVVELLKPRSYNHARGWSRAHSASGETAVWQKKWAFPLAGLGHFRDLEPEIFELQTEPGDLILFCSDGVYPWLKDEDLLAFGERISQTSSLDELLSEQNQNLLAMARSRGSEDNQSIVSLLCSRF